MWLHLKSKCFFALHLTWASIKPKVYFSFDSNASVWIKRNIYPFKVYFIWWTVESFIIVPCLRYISPEVLADKNVFGLKTQVLANVCIYCCYVSRSLLFRLISFFFDCETMSLGMFMIWWTNKVKKIEGASASWAYRHCVVRKIWLRSSLCWWNLSHALYAYPSVLVTYV